MPTGTVSTKHEALLVRLREQVNTLVASDGWQAWLRTAARFRTYSLHNQLLILAQRPDATQVAGYHAWKQLGRQVRQGERGIAIFAPVVRTVADDDDVEKQHRLVGFRIVYVFDVAQTDGEPLPSIEFPSVGLSDETVLTRLFSAAEQAGLQVKTVSPSETLGGARGWYDHQALTITLVSDYPTPSQTRTMLHELAHHCDPAVRDAARDRARCEIVAESAAYVVGTGLGVDMSDASTVYVASWGRGLETASEPELFEGMATEVLDVAAALDQLVGPLLTTA